MNFDFFTMEPALKEELYFLNSELAKFCVHFPFSKQKLF